MTLAGKHAFVTGGGRGIGRAVAAALAGAGAAVTVIGRSEAPLREAVAAGHESMLARKRHGLVSGRRGNRRRTSIF